MKTFAAFSCAAFTLGLGAGIAPSAFAAGPSNVNSCGTISTPGSYVLTRNVSATGHCFNITADNVTLDFDGFVATGDGSTGNAVNMIGSGITVRNGTVRRFGTGIAIFSFAATPDAHYGGVVERMRVFDMVGAGIGGGFGVARDNVVTNNGNTGIALGGGPSIIMNNRIVGNRAGIGAGVGSVVSGNSVANNDLSGIVASCPSLVLGNTAVGHAINISFIGVGCTVEHNAIGPPVGPPIPGP